MDNKKRDDLSRPKQDSQQTDGALKNFVDEISGQGTQEQYNETHRNKSRMVDEQNKMIDKHNLRK